MGCQLSQHTQESPRSLGGEGPIRCRRRSKLTTAMMLERAIPMYALNRAVEEHGTSAAPQSLSPSPFPATSMAPLGAQTTLRLSHTLHWTCLPNTISYLRRRLWPISHKTVNSLDTEMKSYTSLKPFLLSWWSCIETGMINILYSFPLSLVWIRPGKIRDEYAIEENGYTSCEQRL